MHLLKVSWRVDTLEEKTDSGYYAKGLDSYPSFDEAFSEMDSRYPQRIVKVTEEEVYA